MKAWMRRLKGLNRAAITRVETTTASCGCSSWPVRARKMASVAVTPPKYTDAKDRVRFNDGIPRIPRGSVNRGLGLLRDCNAFKAQVRRGLSGHPPLLLTTEAKPSAGRGRR